MVSVYIRSLRYAEVIFERIYTLAALKGLKSKAKLRILTPHPNRPLTDLMYIGIAMIPVCAWPPLSAISVGKSGCHGNVH